MKTTSLAPADQIIVLRAALRLLEIGHVQQAHVDLCEAIKETPPEAPAYAAMVGAANWIDPLNQPIQARIEIAKALITLDN